MKLSLERKRWAMSDFSQTREQAAPIGNEIAGTVHVAGNFLFALEGVRTLRRRAGGHFLQGGYADPVAKIAEGLA